MTNDRVISLKVYVGYEEDTRAFILLGTLIIRIARKIVISMCFRDVERLFVRLVIFILYPHNLFTVVRKIWGG